MARDEHPEGAPERPGVPGSPGRPVLHRVPDPASEAARLVGEALREALDRRGRATVAFSGGSSPLPMFDALAGAADIDWTRVDVLQVDERVAPDGHPDRNATALRDRLAGPAGVPPGNVHLMPVAELAPEAAALAYAATLRRVTGSDRPVLDVVHLGLGADGHTASLVPGDPVLDVDDADVAATRTYEGRRRVTMTYPLLDRAARRVWLVTGEGKDAALEALLVGDATVPAGRLRGPAVVCAPAGHQPPVPGSPLNGPTTSSVIQPP